MDMDRGSGWTPALRPSTVLRGTRPRALLVIVPGSAPRQHRLPDRPLQLGRATHCDVRIGVAGDGTSRRHAELYWQDWRLYVRDLQSKNGLKVNGRRAHDAQLFAGDEIVIGRTRIVILEDPEDASAFLPRPKPRRPGLPPRPSRIGPVTQWESGRLFDPA